MKQEPANQRRRQYCGLCGQLMFEYFHSPDGHFGLADSIQQSTPNRDIKMIYCQTCGARYRLLDRLNAMGKPVAR